MDEILMNVNWTAVLVGTGLAYGLGMLWFGPLFGRAWAKGSHDIQPPAKIPVGALVLQLVGSFFLAWVIGATATINALMTAILIILASAILATAGSLFSLKTMRAALIDGGFIVAMGVVIILCQGIF